MKNINYLINGVLAAAIIILFVLQFSSNKKTKVNASVNTSTEGSLPVAYVNVDSLLQSYNYSKDMTETILKKQENARANVTEKVRKLQSEMQDFQRKIDNNAFLTRERAQQEQERLLNKQKELKALDNRLTNDLMKEQQKLTEQLRDTIVMQLNSFNEEDGRKYQVIFSNTAGDNILIANQAYNITNDIIKYLNKNYSSTK
ncbi:MAG: OmpH family outer membrane protein [Massilibacteroides sp.]|nr:OmpH family outer membrane protein [Massilibacteroides sp.]